MDDSGPKDLWLSIHLPHMNCVSWYVLLFCPGRLLFQYWYHSALHKVVKYELEWELWCMSYFFMERPTSIMMEVCLFCFVLLSCLFICSCFVCFCFPVVHQKLYFYKWTKQQEIFEQVTSAHCTAWLHGQAVFLSGWAGLFRSVKKENEQKYLKLWARKWGEHSATLPLLIQDFILKKKNYVSRWVKYFIWL